MSIDATVSASIETSFFDLFGTQLGVSATTGYDWTETTEATKNEQITIEVKSSVRPGYILQIQQAMGTCGDSYSNTELFKILHIEGETGEIVKEELEWTNI